MSYHSYKNYGTSNNEETLSKSSLKDAINKSRAVVVFVYGEYQPTLSHVYEEIVGNCWHITFLKDCINSPKSPHYDIIDTTPAFVVYHKGEITKFENNFDKFVELCLDIQEEIQYVNRIFNFQPRPFIEGEADRNMRAASEKEELQNRLQSSSHFLFKD